MTSSILQFAKNEGVSAAKFVHNQMFAELTAKKTRIPAFYYSRYQALYLDGSHARTTKELIKAGVNSNKLVPVSCEKLAYKAALELAANAVYGYMDTAIGNNGIDNKANPLAGVWLDYCGTYRGNTSIDVNPKKDLQQLFRYYLAPGSILAMTFCLRDPRFNTYEQTMQDCICDVNSIFINNAYSPESSIRIIDRYQPNMVFMMYELN